jgi:ribonuclease G
MNNSNSDSDSQDNQISRDIEEDIQAAEEEETPPEAVDTGKLQEDASQRARQGSIVQKIARAIRKDKIKYREIIINSEPLERRVALLEDGVLEKFEMERTGDDRIVGSIFKGKIQNLEAGLKAAFVDIGLPKNAFLHYWDILPSVADNSIEVVRDTRTSEQLKKKDRITIKDIPSLYPIGSEIVIQVTKGQIGTKGPRTTTNLALPGRFLVLMPFGGQCGVSRKIENEEERRRLKEILRKLPIPEGMGIIIRTAGENKRWTYFVRDLAILLDQWEEIKYRMEKADEPTCLYKEPDIIERTVRDFLTEDIDRVLVDNDEDCKRMQEMVGRISKNAQSKIAHFDETIPIFERFNIEHQIEQTFHQRVTLPSGGEIVIQETEALVSIDVNTGSHKQKGDQSSFILQVNLEAAHEIARQIRLRNVGGLVIMDFIDMKSPRDRRQVHKVMKEEMEKDKAKCHVLPISQLGIMQMTRQRHKESTSSGIYTRCPYCEGLGIVKSVRTMSVEIQRRLVSIIRRLRALKETGDRQLSLRVLCHQHVLERLRLEDERILVDIEEKYNVRLAFRNDPAFHIENYRILDAETNQELR